MRVRNYGIQISATAYTVYKLVASALADIATGAAVPMLSRGVLCSGVLMTTERTPRSRANRADSLCKTRCSSADMYALIDLISAFAFLPVGGVIMLHLVLVSVSERGYRADYRARGKRSEHERYQRDKRYDLHIHFVHMYLRNAAKRFVAAKSKITICQYLYTVVCILRHVIDVLNHHSVSKIPRLA